MKHGDSSIMMEGFVLVVDPGRFVKVHRKFKDNTVNVMESKPQSSWGFVAGLEHGC